MIAYMIITKRTKRAICNRGTMARRMEFNTTCKPETSCGISIQEWILQKTYHHNIDRLLGTPETSRKGLSTRKARKAFTSKPSILI